MSAYKLNLEESGWMGNPARGSSMGRPDTLPTGAQIMDAYAPLFHLTLMPMTDYGAYDQGSAYWGAGNARIGFMYCAETDASSDDSEHSSDYARLFIRARSRCEAKAQVLRRLPNARFYRAPLDAVTAACSA